MQAAGKRVSTVKLRDDPNRRPGGRRATPYLEIPANASAVPRSAGAVEFSRARYDRRRSGR